MTFQVLITLAKIEAGAMSMKRAILSTMVLLAVTFAFSGYTWWVASHLDEWWAFGSILVAVMILLAAILLTLFAWMSADPVREEVR